MGNRYTTTGFTARQESTLNSINADLTRIYNDRKGKNDSEQSLIRLIRAKEYIEAAIFLSNRHKNSS